MKVPKTTYFGERFAVSSDKLSYAELEEVVQYVDSQMWLAKIEALKLYDFNVMMALEGPVRETLWQELVEKMDGLISFTKVA